LGLTPSAVSASIKTLESFYNVRLFERVGRRIELTQEGRIFLGEAKATLIRARSAKLVLSELGGLKRGALEIHASQTVASYWLPSRLMLFHERHRHVDIKLTVANTKMVARAVLDGVAEIGFIEGSVDEPSLSQVPVAGDELIVVLPSYHPLARDKNVTFTKVIDEVHWIMREEGSGTRSEFEQALRQMGFKANALQVALELPSNEAVLSAVLAGRCAAVVSRSAADPYVSNGKLAVLDLELPPRDFTAVRHKERHAGAAVRKLLEICALSTTADP
jgi:DNA-binding transcriptional LysR family regulator